jgi:hypothetical protein
MPGIEEEILGAIQQAPQPRRQSITITSKNFKGAIVAKKHCLISSNFALEILKPKRYKSHPCPIMK